ncbi:M48 family metalloprotease [Paracoccus sp. R12_1]|uniref:M48 family metalloprotease n=1 Tax=unclassified Paracoccus (in: a-proteobacteria) TaxID=2688777 RepID=UPI000C094E25|nr:MULTISPECIES: M48 family metalloprotease [unclassified Paracoccus (in: a-proteobacteria)]MBO9455588.1 M48 family metalloprotease [Paracoccus sp. R12_2]MBO9486258.1 M48 family metalloprotease [Paracoccus sp. R12_1]PHQ71859.1 MAG: peptidase M48 [Paracoccus sp. (in: a-proteobacteria)]
MSRAGGTVRVAVVILAGLLALSGCAPIPVQQTAGQPPEPAPSQSPYSAGSPQNAARTFVAVMRRMEPAVERECLQRRTQPINCDFQFVVDDRPGLEPNAFQTVDDNGRPIIGFTLSLIAATRNADEIAFVVGHEASHHILNHLERKTGAATAGAVILGSIASVYGGDQSAIETAQRIGASVGSRYYSREWELQADYLGAIIAVNAGFDPVLGSQFFLRIPDPGDHILGTHPSRASRLAQVNRAVADVASGRVR